MNNNLAQLSQKLNNIATSLQQSRYIKACKAWVGEFDILFQGCFTTHADIKRLNRVCENTLYTTEYIASIASLYGYTYPSEGLKNCWQELLFNQFHDIFDDCAKKPTYIFACKQLNGILDKLSEIAKCSLGYIKNI